MHITIYVNKKNAELFRDEPEKSKLINNMLERHYFDTVDGGKTQEQVKQEIAAEQARLRADENIRPVPLEAVLDEPEYDEIFGGLNQADLVYSRADGAVFDTSTEERIEATPEMIKELKRRNQVV